MTEVNAYEFAQLFFSSLTITQLVIHLTGALLELYADDTQEIQVMASGDDHDMKAVSLVQNGDTLTMEQSAAALSPLPLSARWLQVTVRIPRAWKGRVEIRTTSGSVHVRGLQVSDLSVESLSGFVMLSDLSSLSLKVKNGSGDIAGSDLSGQDCSLFTTTGMLCLERLAFLNISLSSVSRGAMLSFAEMFSTFKGGSVAGSISLEIPGAQCDAILRSVSGRLLTDGVSIVDGAPSVRVTTASGQPDHPADFPGETDRKRIIREDDFFMARQNFGFGGGANMQQLMRQAQKMQQAMTDAQEKLDAQEYEAQSGGGVVSVKVNGKRELLSLTIDPKVVDPDDVEMLQDLVMAAVNEALRKGEANREETMNKMAPGMGGMGGLF